MFTRINPRHNRWTNGSVFVVLPEDKRTFRVTDINGNKLVATNFRSFKAAVAAASNI